MNLYYEKELCESFEDQYFKHKVVLGRFLSGNPKWIVSLVHL